MKSSSGQYYLGLDHIRAMAVLMVYCWHFLTINAYHHAPPPMFPLSFFSEGHTGVGLFMTLSGYLFAKLLDGRKIKYLPFLWNRFLRLAPLLIIVIILAGLESYYVFDREPALYLDKISRGAIWPTLPNGGWSITVEFHFYLLLPLLLFFARKSAYAMLIVVGLAVLYRVYLYQKLGDVHYYSYWTIIGRIDQFVLGIFAYQIRGFLYRKHALVLSIIILFAIFFWYFDLLGGFYKSTPRNSIWIYMTTFEGIAYAALISWYDNSFKHPAGRVSRFIALIGAYSYSIYLLHFFVVFRAATAIYFNLVTLSNIYLAILFAILSFSLMIPIAYLSNKFIESPFLKLRTTYIVKEG